MTIASPSRLWPWIAALIGLVALAGAGWQASRLFDRPDVAPSPQPPGDPADIVAQVHNFCGAACHAYPPPDTFPRKHWRAEVERGFRFAEQAGLPMTPPPVEA